MTGKEWLIFRGMQSVIYSERREKAPWWTKTMVEDRRDAYDANAIASERVSYRPVPVEGKAKTSTRKGRV